jgi:hypothetical protein
MQPAVLAVKLKHQIRQEKINSQKNVTFIMEVFLVKLPYFQIQVRNEHIQGQVT